MTETEMIELRNYALTELFNSNVLQKKIEGICLRHRIPLNADIQSDILQTTFENLTKYKLDRFIEAYNDNPNRILALAVKIALTKGVYKDTRAKKGWNHSIAQQILHSSTLSTCNSDDNVTLNRLTSDELIQENNEDNYIQDQKEQEFIDMWAYIRQNLTEQENETLQVILQPEMPKLKGQLKKDYMKLLPRIKTLIKEYHKK